MIVPTADATAFGPMNRRTVCVASPRPTSLVRGSTLHLVSCSAGTGDISTDRLNVDWLSKQPRIKITRCEPGFRGQLALNLAPPFTTIKRISSPFGGYSVGCTVHYCPEHDWPSTELLFAKGFGHMSDSSARSRSG